MVTSYLSNVTGVAHKRARDMLIARHKDGAPCWWCGKPMYKDKARNFDKLPLAADHVVARRDADGLPTRLLHFSCNSARGAGDRDSERPVLKEARKPTRTGFSWGDFGN